MTSKPSVNRTPGKLRLPVPFALRGPVAGYLADHRAAAKPRPAAGNWAGPCLTLSPPHIRFGFGLAALRSLRPPPSGARIASRKKSTALDTARTGATIEDIETEFPILLGAR